jgi:hypothetical protein
MSFLRMSQMSQTKTKKPTKTKKTATKTTIQPGVGRIPGILGRRKTTCNLE